MNKLILSVCASAIALFGPAVSAQTHKAGEDMAAPSKPATAAEKDAARKKRREASREISRSDASRLEDKPTTAGTGRTVSAEEKAAAREKRKAEGKAAAKSGSGRNEDAPTSR